MKLGQSKILVVAVAGVGVVIPVALAFPFTRAWILALCIAVTAWVVLLPRGWYHQSDHRTRQILTTFLVARLAMMVVFELFGQGLGGFTGGGSDSRAYAGAGRVISEQITLEGFSRSHRETPGTGAIDLAVGYFFWLAAPVRNAATFLWASASTIGLLLFWTSTRHLAAQRPNLYTAAVLLLPTLLFWNSGVGKEAPLILGTAAMIAGVFYVAEQGRVPTGIAYLAFGVFLTGSVRPHITFLIIVSAAVGVTVASRRASAVTLGRRVVTLGIVGIALVVVVPLALQLIDPTGSRSFIDAATASAESNLENYQPGAPGAGGSAFTTITVQSPLDVPQAVITVLFRPFPWEVRSPTQALAALEATVLGLVSVLAGWSILTGRAKFNRTPLTMSALSYTLLFSVAFVSLGNFGLLVRQRMQVVGFLLVVLFSVQSVVRDSHSIDADDDINDPVTMRSPGTQNKTQT